MGSTREKQWVLLGLIAFGLIYSVVVFFTYVPAGGADNYAHFNISRWAFRYPQLFLDHWGKPVFTIFTAPLAQLGFEAVRVFNIVAGILTAWFCYLIAKKNQLKPAWFVPLAAIFIPVYFLMMSSGMTEVLFSLFLVISIYLFFKEKYIWSAFLISFIFLIRTEGLPFLLLFLIGFLVKKQYRAIPFLITGFLLFSFIGWIYYYHDFWWLITNRPYAKGGPSVYGSGNWYHFLVKMPTYLGYIITVLLILGTIVIVVNWVKSKLNIKTNPFIVIILIPGCFWGYFIIHCYLWWAGITSAGLTRVMAGVTPLAALIAMYAINISFKRLPKKVNFGLVVLISVFLIVSGYISFNRSVKGDLSKEVLDRTVEWLKDSGNLRHRIVIHNPYFAFAAGKDVWDVNVVQNGFSNNNHPEANLPDSSIFIWDAHFSANEGRMPLEKMLDNPYFQPIKYFRPNTPFKVLGGNDYRIVIFRKVAQSEQNNFLTLETLKNESPEGDVIFSQIYRFESLSEGNNIQIQLNDSLINVCNMENVEFSPAFEIDANQFDDLKKNKVILSARFYFKNQTNKNRCLMVFSVEKENQSYSYNASDIYEPINELNQWNFEKFIFHVPEKLKEESKIKAYIWNINKSPVLIDDFKIEIIK